MSNFPLLASTVAACILLACSSTCTAAFFTSGVSTASLSQFTMNTDTRIYSSKASSDYLSRRRLLFDVSAAVTASTLSFPLTSAVNAAPLPEGRLDVDSFLRSGIDPNGVMGVSGQAGKSRPETGVIFRDGTDLSQDAQGGVLAELLVGSTEDPTAVLASFAAPWPLAKGTVFDVECRDPKSGDTAFLIVTKSTKTKALEELPATFFTERLFDPTGRFSFYGPPTDIKIKNTKSSKSNYRFIDLAFSNLSQSTNAEIPRRATLAATIVPGTNRAVCLVVSANANRWTKGGSEAIARKIVDSFQVTAAPKSSLKVRAKDRRQNAIDVSEMKQ
ncbi:hypothetical protein MPSEU_000577400 [Mayamaea pseudoterrestris]|nr:hypothetical protein MPSEU_000577400 [Mayamaea pseudoterrestris]